MQLKTKPLSGFTLVELLVSVIILAILATLWNIEYNKYLSDVRDTNRLAQLNWIGQGLSSYQVYNSLPLPDNNIEIYGSGALIGYQWYMWDNALEVIEYSNSWLDPLDKVAVSYYVNAKKNKFQLLSFLEIPADKQTSILSQAHANVDYSFRFIKVYGDKLGIFTDSNYTPIQEIDSIISAETLDIANTPDTYISHFDDYISISGTGETLKWVIAGGGLVGYWNFESIDGTTIQDSSPYENRGAVSWGTTLAAGKSGNGLFFDGVNDDFVVDDIPNLTANQAPTHTIAAWVYPNDTSCILTSCQQWALFLWDRDQWINSWSWTHHWYVWWSDGSSFWLDTKKYNPPLVQDTWNHVAITFNGEDVNCFLNGKQTCSRKKSPAITSINMKSSDLVLGRDISGGNNFFHGTIDNLRIYDRVLSASEIRTIYNVEK